MEWIDHLLTVPELAESSDERPANEHDIQRKYLAILKADLVGYSEFIQQDDLGTVRRLTHLRRHIIEPTAHRCNVIFLRHTGGDGLLAAFDGPEMALYCAIAIQRGMQETQAHMSAESQFTFRIGIAMGPTLIADGDLHGTPVNIAARLQELAAPGDIYLEAAVVTHSHARNAFQSERIGTKKLRNIHEAIVVRRIENVLEPVLEVFE